MCFYTCNRCIIYSLGLLILLNPPGHSCGSSCTCECGSGTGPTKAHSGQSRIWDGTEVAEGGRPFQVRLIYGDVSKCGGVIYNSLNILTAAHCLIKDAPLSQLRAYVGLLTTPTSISDPGAVSEAVSGILTHPQHQQRSAGFDLGIVKLSAPIKYGPNVQPLPIIEPGLDLVGKIGTTSGWGQISLKNASNWRDPVTSPILRQASGIILSKQECKDLLKKNFKRVPKGGGEELRQLVCYHGLGGRGPCPQDSGGPLTCQVDPGMEGNPTRLCGIVSTGYDCGHDTPVMHTQVNHPNLFKWILDNAGTADIPTIKY